MKVEDILERIQEVRPNEAIKLRSIFEQQFKEIGLLQRRLDYIGDYVYKNHLADTSGLTGSHPNTYNPCILLIESHELQVKEIRKLKELLDESINTISKQDVSEYKKDRQTKGRLSIAFKSIKNALKQTLSKYRKLWNNKS